MSHRHPWDRDVAEGRVTCAGDAVGHANGPSALAIRIDAAVTGGHEVAALLLPAQGAGTKFLAKGYWA